MQHKTIAFAAVLLAAIPMTHAGDTAVASAQSITEGTIPADKLTDARAAVAHFAGAPASIREFLVKAETADAIVDPLERCLAFPDLPGNHWPEGLAKAHCELIFGRTITLAKVSELVGRGAFAELDALFAADLERHFRDEDFSEVIHRDFDAFDDSYESGRLTKIWIEKAPTSAYALDARAVFYRRMAESARGEKWISETPPENIARMHEFVDLAVDLFQRALKVEPRLLPAYVGLINVSRIDSRTELGETAMLDAKRVDPACRSVSGAQMMGLEPRWGGSYPEMLQLAQEIAPFVSRRPLLALNTIWPYVDLGNHLYAEDKYDQAIETLKPLTLQSTHPEPYEYLASSMLLNKDAVWEPLLYMMAAARYSEGDAFFDRERGKLLLRAQRPEWAVKYIKRSLEADPDNAQGQSLLADAMLATDSSPH